MCLFMCCMCVCTSVRVVVCDVVRVSNVYVILVVCVVCILILLEKSNHVKPDSNNQYYVN